MRLYYVSCEFNADDEYEDFATALDEYPAWYPAFGENWFVVSEDTAEDIYENLVDTIFEGDFMFVAEVRDNYMSLIPDEAVEWLERNFE